MLFAVNLIFLTSEAVLKCSKDLFQSRVACDILVLMADQRHCGNGGPSEKLRFKCRKSVTETDHSFLCGSRGGGGGGQGSGPPWTPHEKSQK